MPHTAHPNINKLYVIKVVKWFMLFMPIVVPFYQSNGLGMQEIFILRSVYSVTIVIFEIPSGYVADIWGRKNTIINGLMMGFAGFVIYSFARGFWGFLWAEIVLGIGQSLISGTDSALLYDSLLERDRQDAYLQYEGKMVSYGNFSEAIAGVIGGLIAGISLRTPYLCQSVIAFSAIPVAFMLKEPSRQKFEGKQIIKNLKYVIRYAMFTNKRLQKFILFSAIIGTSTLTMAWFVQPYLKEVGLKIEYFGITWTLLNATVGLTAMYAYKMMHFIGQRSTFIFITLSIAVGYFLIGGFQVLWGIVFLFFFYAIRGIATPILKEYINHLTASYMRSTVLSIRSFIIRLNFALIGPFLGWYTDVYSLQAALLLGGLLFFILSSLVLFYLLRAIRHEA